MEDKYQKAKQILIEYNQEHLLTFYNELTYEQKDQLLNQILKIDFEQILTLYKNSYIEIEKNDTISPLPYYSSKDLNNDLKMHYQTIGYNAIQNNEVAVITLAGGQGSRLGFDGPKGTFRVDLSYSKKSLFEIQNDVLQKLNQKYDISIPWYIMTSKHNNKSTINFFENHNYFNYKHNNIYFFEQDQLPVVDIKGNLMLTEPHVINEASNGNGDVYRSLNKAGLIDNMKRQGVKWIFISGIDNILLKLVDPVFLGMTIENNKAIASKSIYVETGDMNTGVFCKRNSRPSILLPSEITNKIHESNNYRDANALAHLMNIETLENAVNIKLPYHRAYKKNTYVNEEGMKQIPDSPNSFKFELFIFDMFEYFNDMLLYRVEKEKEFAPIKDIVSMDTATKLYKAQTQEFDKK